MARKAAGRIEAGDRVLIEHHVSKVWDDGKITIEVAGAPVTIRARITWSRTVIGGQTAPEDFYAHDELGRGVGRIYRQITGHEVGGWWWTMNAWAKGG